MQKFDTPAAITAVLDIPAGRVEFIAADQADTTVEVLPSDAAKSRDVKVAEETTVEYGDGVLRIEASAKNQILGAGGSIDVTVRLPAGSRVEAKAASADVRTAGRFDEVTFDGAQAAIVIEEAAAARLTVQAGDVSIGRLTGPARISTAKGDIRIAEAVSGTLVLSTQAGDIHVDAAAGVSASLDAGTSYGRVRNALRNSEGPDAQLDIHATTAYGDITARSL